MLSVIPATLFKVRISLVGVIIWLLERLGRRSATLYTVLPCCAESEREPRRCSAHLAPE